MENKYKNGKIYKIVDNTNGNIYVGSTIQPLNIRLNQHRRPCRNVSREIIKNGDYKIELIKNFPCKSKYELEEEEKKYILENECINITIPHRTKAEWNEINKERLKDISKQKLECDCGAIVRKYDLARHKKTLKHIKFTECL